MLSRFLIGLFSAVDPRTLRGRVTLILNGTLVILLGLFLLIDFQRDFADRIALKRTALDEQARLIEPGIEAAGRDSLKGFLNATHARMNNVHHSDHWLAVRITHEWISIGVPDRNRTSILKALTKVSLGEQNPQQAFEGKFLVGGHKGAEAEIYVAETYEEVHTAISADLSRHLWGVGVILLTGIVTINLVMNAGFLVPLTTFAAVAQAIGKGDFCKKITAIGMRELDDLAVAFNGMSDQLAEIDQARAAQMHKARLI